jgi:hypothetical protein
VVVLTDKSISFLVLQRVLQQALKTLKLNAATSDFSVINYEEAKFVITLKDGRKYTVTIARVEWTNPKSPRRRWWPRDSRLTALREKRSWNSVTPMAASRA